MMLLVELSPPNGRKFSTPTAQFVGVTTDLAMPEDYLTGKV